jgi:hypothetical protein
MHVPARLALLAAIVLSTAACANRTPNPPLPAERPTARVAVSGRYEILYPFTAEGVGAGQALFVRGDNVYILGDLRANNAPGPGVIREFFWSSDPQGRRTLFPSGRQILLTDNGADIARHPTGLTWNANFGYWLGDTVDRKGTLFQIDFERALTQGTLNGCVIRRVEDDAAVNGTRPLFFELPGGRWTLATSDYGESANALRLYDPVALLTASKTSEPGVVVAEAPCGPFVQSLAWLHEEGQLWLVQNITEGLGYRLTELSVDEAGRIRASEVTDFSSPTDELEAFAWMDTDRRQRRGFIMLSASPAGNIHIGRQNPPAGPWSGTAR